MPDYGLGKVMLGEQGRVIQESIGPREQDGWGEQNQTQRNAKPPTPRKARPHSLCICNSSLMSQHEAKTRTRLGFQSPGGSRQPRTCFQFYF